MLPAGAADEGDPSTTSQVHGLVDEEDTPPSPTFSSFSGSDNPSSNATSYVPDPHAVSRAEALSYYVGLPSEPTLLYRTGKEWSPPRGIEAHRRRKELREVFDHPIVSVWNHDLGWKVVDILDAYEVLFTTIDVVRFKMVEVDEPPSDEEDADEETEEVRVKKPVISPVTIWIGVFPTYTSATVAHNSAQAILSLLKDYQIIDVDVDFRESYYVRQAGPQLLKPVEDVHPLADVISSLTPTLGLRISTTTRPSAQGTMGLYLAEGDNSSRLLGLTCRHVLIGPKEPNTVFNRHRSGPRMDVILLGDRGFNSLIDTIEQRINYHGDEIERRNLQIGRLEKKEKDSDTDAAIEARQARIEVQRLVRKAREATDALNALLTRVKRDWKKPKDRVLGPVRFSPAMAFGVGKERFTEDWGVFQIDRAKLGDGFQGNKIDLGTTLTPSQFRDKCFPRGDANWSFEYPNDGLLPLHGIIPSELMCKPDMQDVDGQPCLLVVKHGNATDTTLGRATGVFSIVRQYLSNRETSMEWTVINYDNKSGVFSEPGDSGSIIADIHGRIGGMLTSGAGQTEAMDVTYATPFWWLLQRIKDKFPNVHVNVLD